MAKKLSVPVFRFLGGKGGVGKTTCAAALAVADADAGLRTLVISADPAPSLGDAFRKRLGAVPRPAGLRGLHAVEIDARKALDTWLADRRDALERAALRGTWLDQEDVARLLRLSLPGIDEIAALLEISRFGRSGSYDSIVVDTAPTGHTLRMLSMPETLLTVARLFDRMQAKHRVMVEALRGAWRPEPDDLVIASMADEARELAALLRDPTRVTMSWVTLPEPMAVEETMDAAGALAAQDIPVAEVIVNRATPEPPSRCRWCAARRAFEAGAIASLQRRLADSAPAVAVRLIEAQAREPAGIRALRKVAGGIGDARGNGNAHRFRRNSAKTVSVPVSAKLPEAFSKKLAGTLTVELPATLLMFGGKGGVGKTTCAAAAAIAAAQAHPDRRVLLISTDPAHSLADALGVALSDTPRPVPDAPANLQARELDAAAGFERVRARFHSAIDALFDRFSRNTAFDAPQDRRVVRDLIDLAPPGVDELAAVIDVLDTVEAHRERGDMLVVVDTAPSGHALRLLEMPAVVQDWAKALMAILLKYQPVVGVGELGAVLLKLSQGLGRLRTLLADPKQTQFAIVTRAAALPRAETLRLFSKLSRLHIRVPAMVVNAVGAGECERCRRQQRVEAKEIAALRRALRARSPEPVTIAAPARVPPPHGATPLATWQRAWRTTD